MKEQKDITERIFFRPYLNEQWMWHEKVKHNETLTLPRFNVQKQPPEVFMKKVFY